MRVAKRNCKRVRGIVGFWRLLESEQHCNHTDDLLLLGASVAYDCLLDLERRVFGDVSTEGWTGLT